MRIRRASVHPYRLRLTEPVVWGGVAHAVREGLLLRVEATDGAVGWGDAAPLPGFSTETLADARRALRDITAFLTGADTDDILALRPLASPSPLGVPPSVRFALDLAFAEVTARQACRSLPDVLANGVRPAPGRPVVALPEVLPIAGLILGGDAPAEAARLAAAGYRAVKLKVGRADVDADAAAVRAVRAALGPGLALRLDANRAWTDADARRFADAVAGVEIAFVEEPLVDPSGLEALARETGLPVALDESLHEAWVPGRAPRRLFETVPPWAAAAVLKPTLVGGLAAAMQLAQRARADGVPVVLSAAFESGIGVRGVAALALATGGEPTGRRSQPAGLDPYRWLAADVLAERLPVEHPEIRAAALFDRPPVVALP